MKRSNWVRLIAVILIISMLAAPVSAATNRGNDGVRTNGVVGIIVDFIRDIIRDIFDDWFDEPGEEEPTPTTPVNPTTPTPTQPGETTAPEEATEPLSPFVEAYNSDTGEMVTVLREYAEVYEMNPHMVGWIKIEGTPVNYPVVQTPNYTNYYLYRDFNRDDNSHG